jgi:predicted metal-dependent HD superfamily phosphohydrolase
MKHEIPAFLKLNIDSFRALDKAPGGIAPAPIEGRPVRASEPRRVRASATPDHSALDTSIRSLALASTGPDLIGGGVLLSLWAEHWQGIGGGEDTAGLGSQLIEAYRDPKRSCHNLTWLIEGLRLAQQWHDEADRPDELAVAVWFHDAIHDASRHDSEARSARWALDALTAGGVPFDAVRRIRDLIVATRPHETPSTDDARLIVDIDMAVYGAEAARYDKFESQLRLEHGHMADFIYRRKRLATLKAMLSRQRLYFSSVARKQLEERARENIGNAINRLQESAAVGCAIRSPA